MATVKRLCKWFWLMTKRMYKRPVFVAVLILIPLVVIGYHSTAQEDSGVMTIALAREDDDPLAVQIIHELTGEDSLIRYLQCQTPQQAEAAVRVGKADAAWIFLEDTSRRVADFVESRSKKDAFVQILERETTIALLLSREKLGGAVFAGCSQELYLQYLRENHPEVADRSDQQLMEYYEAALTSVDLFTFHTIDGEKVDAHGALTYLTAPVRGLLAVAILLCAMANAMFFMQDWENGTFALVPESRKAWVELGFQLVAGVNVAAVSLVSMAAAGLTVGFAREILVHLLYVLCSAVFAMVLRRLCGSVKLLAALLPVLTVVMLVVCPVFFDLAALRQLQYLFPPTYYVSAAFSTDFLKWMLFYPVAGGGAYYLIGKLFRRK